MRQYIFCELWYHITSFKWWYFKYGESVIYFLTMTINCIWTYALYNISYINYGASWRFFAILVSTKIPEWQKSPGGPVKDILNQPHVTQNVAPTDKIGHNCSRSYILDARFFGMSFFCINTLQFWSLISNPICNPIFAS